jgi:hypothetical protein
VIVRADDRTRADDHRVQPLFDRAPDLALRAGLRALVRLARALRNEVALTFERVRGAEMDEPAHAGRAARLHDVARTLDVHALGIRVVAALEREPSSRVVDDLRAFDGVEDTRAIGHVCRDPLDVEPLERAHVFADEHAHVRSVFQQSPDERSPDVARRTGDDDFLRHAGGLIAWVGRGATTR